MEEKSPLAEGCNPMTDRLKASGAARTRLENYVRGPARDARSRSRSLARRRLGLRRHSGSDKRFLWNVLERGEMPAAGKLGGMGTGHLSIARGQILSTVVQLSHLLSSLFQKPDCFEPAVNSSKSLGHIKLNFVQLVSNFPVSENRSRQYKRERHQYWNIMTRPMIKFSKILAACFPT